MAFKHILKNSSFYKKIYKDSFIQKIYLWLRSLPYVNLIFWRKQFDLFRTLPDIKLFSLHLRIRKILVEQNKNWPQFVYSWGYFYQGYERIKITGIRSTEIRMKNYNFLDILDDKMKVLDIGANAGFFAIELSDKVELVDAIEWNHYQTQIGEEVCKYLGINNVHFYAMDFKNYESKYKYDIIMSLANHHTTDGGLRPKLRKYFQDIYNNLNQNGRLFFESHPEDINNDFKSFMSSLDDIFSIERREEVTDGKLGGRRLFYILKKQ